MWKRNASFFLHRCASFDGKGNDLLAVACLPCVVAVVVVGAVVQLLRVRKEQHEFGLAACCNCFHKQEYAREEMEEVP